MLVVYQTQIHGPGASEIILMVFCGAHILGPMNLPVVLFFSVVLLLLIKVRGQKHFLSHRLRLGITGVWAQFSIL